MMRRVRSGLMLAAVVVIVAAISGGTVLPRSSAATAQGRTIYVAAIEPKGGVTVDKEPFPTSPLPGGGGYVLNAPDRNGRWEVSVYQWSPSFILVNQGEQVTLEFIGINGAEHVSTIPGLVQSFSVKRGQITRVTFRANRAGMFPFLCANHQPSMTGYLVVLPRQ